MTKNRIAYFGNIPEDAYKKPIEWLEILELQDLQNWLEDALCLESPAPIWVPHDVNYVRYLAEYLSKSKIFKCSYSKSTPEFSRKLEHLETRKLFGKFTRILCGI